MNEPARLQSTHLTRLEELLANQKAPVVQHLQASASEPDLERIEVDLDLTIPDELRLLWEWRDGTDLRPHEPAVRGLVGPTFMFHSLKKAAEATHRCRAFARETAPEDPAFLWRSSWLAIASDGRVACECDVDKAAPVPVLDVDYHKAQHPGAVAARSLGEMVRWWIEALESGGWAYDSQHDRWDQRLELLPRERERTGLV